MNPRARLVVMKSTSPSPVYFSYLACHRDHPAASYCAQNVFMVSSTFTPFPAPFDYVLFHVSMSKGDSGSSSNGFLAFLSWSLFLFLWLFFLRLILGLLLLLVSS